MTHHNVNGREDTGRSFRIAEPPVFMDNAFGTDDDDDLEKVFNCEWKLL